MRRMNIDRHQMPEHGKEQETELVDTVDFERLCACTKKTIGNNIVRLRKQAGITQKSLAVRSGLHIRGLGGIERGEGNPSLETLLRLAYAMDLDFRAFFVD